MARSLTINGTERWGDYIDGSLHGNLALTYAQDVLDFEVRGAAPEYGQPVELSDGSVVLFSGVVVGVDLAFFEHTTGACTWKVQCNDWQTVLDGALVVEAYTATAADDVVADLATKYAADFTTSIQADAPVIDYIAFDYLPFPDAMKALCEYVGWQWYADHQKVIHFFDPLTLNSPAPLALTPGGAFSGFTFTVQKRGLRNRVFVLGGTELSDDFVHSQAADGTADVFWLPHKPHDLSLTVGGAAKTVGIENVDDEASFAYMMNYQQQYVRCSSGTTKPTAGTAVVATYKYDVPIITVAEDLTSQALLAAVQGGDGVYEAVLEDTSLTTTEAAQARAEAELREWANPTTVCSFRTSVDGFQPGQILAVDLPERGASGFFVVLDVDFEPLNEQVWTYRIKAGSRLKGLLDFLRDLASKNKQASYDPTAVLQKISVLRDRLTATDELTRTTEAATAAIVGTAIVGYSEVSVG